ncbi:MAG: tetratricopeptide repeat protein [bacterium]|nr:tetratricopeptide repeat protein [bacterium]
MAVSLAVFANALANPFIIDDLHVIGGDPNVRALGLGELLISPYCLPPLQDQLYRPLTKVSFAINWAVSSEPWAFRLPNVLLHAAVAYVVFLLARCLTGSFWSAAIAALLFAVHPIHTEPLNAIVGRADLGAALFGLLTVWCCRSNVDGGGWRPPVAVACYAVSLLFKESAAPIVGVVILLDVCLPRATTVVRRPGWWRRRILRVYLPLLLVFVAYLSARGAVLGGLARDASEINLADNVIAHPDHGLGESDSRFLARWGTPLATFGRSVELLVWPRPLCWDYSYAAIETVKRITDRRLLVGALCSTLIGVALVLSWRGRRVAFAPLVLWLGTYSIVSNTVVLIGTVFAERLLYLPSAGFCLLLGVWAGWSARTLVAYSRRAAWLVPLGIGLLISLCVLQTVERNRDWRSRADLDWTDVETNPRSSRLLSSAATAAVNAGELDRAEKYARRAIEVHPDCATAWSALGEVYRLREETTEALVCFRECFRRGGAGEESAVVQATRILVSLGDYGQAIALLERLASRHATAATARNNLAWYLLTAEPVELRDAAAALTYAEQALALTPDNAGIIDTYAAALVAMGRTDEARKTLQDALILVPPDDPERQDLEERLRELPAR